MNDDRVDLSLVDPARRKDQWERRVDRVAALARALPARRGIAHQLRAWAVPALAIAASMALVSWAGALMRGGGPSDAPATRDDPALELSRLAAQGENVSATTLLRVLGGGHGAE